MDGGQDGYAAYLENATHGILCRLVSKYPMAHTERTVCDPNCHANPHCGLSATIEAGRIVEVNPASYPVPGFENRICLMGRSRLEYQYHPERLRQPLRRVGERGEGKWQAIGWDEAVTLFVENQRRISDRYGPRSVVFTSISGAFGVLTRGAPMRYAALTGATVQGLGGIDFGVPTGLGYMFNVPGEYIYGPGGHSLDDVSNSEITLIWGGNPAVTRSVDHVALKRARRDGTKLICIDPVRSETSKFCDDWISIRPGSDGALALAMIHEVIANGSYDEEFLVDHTNVPFLVDRNSGDLLRERDILPGGRDDYLVWDAQQDAPAAHSRTTSPLLRKSGEIRLANGGIASVATAFELVAELAARFEPDAAAKITQIPADRIRALARQYARARPAAIRVGYGIDRWYNSDVTARAIATLVCFTGNIGIPGGGISLTEGSKPVPLDTRCFLLPTDNPPNVLSMMEVDRAVREGQPYPIKMECVSLGNPYNQVKPNRAKVLRDYIGNLEFIAVIDHFMTDTAKYADLVLPACTIFERSDLVVDRFLQLQQRVVEPEGEARSDFEIFKSIADSSGLGAYFEKSPEGYIEEMLNASGPELADVTFARLKEEKVVAPRGSAESFVAFSDRVFSGPSGRIEVYKESLKEHGVELPVYREPVEASPGNPLFEKYPLVLLSSHSRYRIHSTFANLEKTKAREPTPIVRVHPSDADTRAFSDGDIVKVFNDRGHLKIECRVDDSIRPGCVLISEGHWTEHFIEGDPYILTHDLVSPTSENYAHYDVLVEMAPLHP